MLSDVQTHTRSSVHLQECYCGAFGPHPGWWFRFPYDDATREAFKAAVPATHRAWDEHNKRWFVHKQYERALLAIFPEFDAFLNQPRLFQ